ncbi:MAG: SPASM domain-containing protein [Bacteroidales bacterium]|nr:SPASM domain-containing protein [Bacteroidales bacterium]
MRQLSIGWSYIFNRLTMWGSPWSFSIEPSNVCNLRCRECFTGLGLSKRKPHFISEEDFTLAINQIRHTALNLFLYFQGEPYSNPQFTRLIEIAHSSNIFTVTSSNGHLINNDNAENTVLAGLDKIIIPLDGYSQDSYSAYRSGGSFAAAKNAITLIANAKRRLRRKNPVIEVQCLASKITENHLKEIKRIAIECGADKFCVKTMQIETDEGFEKFLPTNQRLSRYTRDNELKHKVKFCRRIFQSVVITSELNVLPCCYDKETQFILGNLHQASLHDIIHSSKAKELYNRILYSLPHLKMCKNCGG